MIDAKKVVANLQAARDLLARPNGYVRGVRRDNKGAYCALGALDMVKGTYHTDAAVENDPIFGSGACEPELIALSSAIPSRYLNDGVYDKYNRSTVHQDSDPTKKIACYNNNTDQKTVVEWFDRAIRIQTEHPMENA